MFSRSNLLDDYDFSHVKQTWKEYFLSIFSCIINLPLDFYYIFRVQMYLYYLRNGKRENIFNSNLEKLNLQSPTDTQKDIDNGKIICWNIQYGNAILKLDTLSEIIKFLEEEKPEILVLQEILKNEKFNQIEILKQKLGFHHSHFHENIDFQCTQLGNLILSQSPINILKSYRGYQIVEIIRNEKPLILVNVHLPSDLTCFKQNKIVSALIFELRKIKKEKQGCEFLITGDFNLLSWSREIKALQNLFDLLPNQQYTFPSNYPLVKYDYVFHHGFQTEPFLQIRDSALSDHTPLVIQLT